MVIGVSGTRVCGFRSEVCSLICIVRIRIEIDDIVACRSSLSPRPGLHRLCFSMSQNSCPRYAMEVNNVVVQVTAAEDRAWNYWEIVKNYEHFGNREWNWSADNPRGGGNDARWSAKGKENGVVAPSTESVWQNWSCMWGWRLGRWYFLPAKPDLSSVVIASRFIKQCRTPICLRWCCHPRAAGEICC